MSKHPNKEIREALEYALANGWRVEKAEGKSAHRWGSIYCPYNDTSCRLGRDCITSIWSTPKNPQNHAKRLRRVVDGCTGESQNPEPPTDESDDA